ncbi:hypothetical protein, partial [Streptomyces sp. NPDC041003]|uniref:hypothetical protein n=1 Tax=Streptomyces sp. NPDC041003 TaxID=3155730 RepID=UPI0033F54383
IQPFTSSYATPANANWDWNAIQLHSGDVNGVGAAVAVAARRIGRRPGSPVPPREEFPHACKG